MQTVITYSEQPHGAPVDLCALHASGNRYPSLMQVQAGAHDGRCYDCTEGRTPEAQCPCCRVDPPREEGGPDVR